MSGSACTSRRRFARPVRGSSVDVRDAPGAMGPAALSVAGTLWAGGVRRCDRLNIDSMPPDRYAADERPTSSLVGRARAGDRAAYGELVRRHQSAALRLAAGVCGSTEEARDIVQDAFVKGYRSLDRYRGEAPVRSWLLRIVANEAKNAVRGASRRRPAGGPLRAPAPGHGRRRSGRRACRRGGRGRRAARRCSAASTSATARCSPAASSPGSARPRRRPRSASRPAR